jgi:hypothetical protein
VIASTSPPATTAPSPVTGLGKLLLGEEHLPAEFATPRLRTHQPDPSDPDLIESCPAASSVDRIDVMLTWSSTAEGDQIELGQFIGRADSSAEASEVVSLFGEVGSCDLSESFGEEVETTGGEAAISGADAAANLVIRPIDGSFLGEMIVVAVGDVVMIVSVGTTFGSDWEGDPPLDLDLADEIAEIALAKVRAAGR